MFWILIPLCALMLAGVFAYWLGWGRTKSWREVSGFVQLSQPNLDVCESARLELEIIGCRLRWWGHATVSLEWAGTQLVFDPINSARVKVTPRRFDDLALEDGADFDAIVVSHAHMDHLDLGTLERLAPSRLWLPAGSERFLSPSVLSKHQVEPIRLEDTVSVGNLKVTPVTAKHGGWRYPWQRGLFACGYIVEHGEQTLYIAGDTALGPHFEVIGQKYHPIAAVLPIGAYSPEWLLRSRHLNPEEALDAAAMLGDPVVIPCHFGTYRLSFEPMDAPLLRFVAEAKRRGARWFLPTEE